MCILKLKEKNTKMFFFLNSDGWWYLGGKTLASAFNPTKSEIQEVI